MSLWSIALPAPVAIAIVAAIGYLFGRRSWRRTAEDLRVTGSRELRRAQQVIHQLEAISREVRLALANHHASVMDFKDRIRKLSGREDASVWHQLAEESERMLAPTLLLSTQVAHAYDEIRRQTNELMSFTDVRTDPLTGLSNRKAMEETLDRLLAVRARYNTEFSLALLDLDRLQDINDRHGHGHGDEVLKQFAALLEETARESDVLVRFGGEEFVVIMPETDQVGSGRFCQRLCEKAERELPVTVSAGVTTAMDGDSLHSLIARADSALYSAKASGGGCVYCHTGRQIEAAEQHSLQDATRSSTRREFAESGTAV